MFFTYPTLKKSISFAPVHYLIICFLWIYLCLPVYAQTAVIPEKEKTGKIQFDETGITVKAEDVERAQINEEEVKAGVGKSIQEIRAFIRGLEDDVKAMNNYRDRLLQEKKGYQESGESHAFVELLEREIEGVKEKIDRDNEQIETYEDRITVLQNQLKVNADLVALLTRIGALEDEILMTPDDAAPMIRKETDSAKDYIAEIQESIKEKEAVVSFFTSRLKEIRDKTRNDEQNLAKELISVKEGRRNDELSRKLQEKIDSIVLLKKAVSEQWVTIFKTRLETSKIRYDIGLQAWKNAELNAAFLAEKARRLDERLKERKLIK